MLENLDFIYEAMYIIDIRDSIVNLLSSVSLALWLIWCIVWFCTAMMSFFDYCDDKPTCFGTLWKHTKVYQIISFVILAICLVLTTIMPSSNTMKAYIGVKATQAVGTYLETNTEIPTRCKKTITNLWDKVDVYISSIDVEKTINTATDSVVTNLTNNSSNVKELTTKATNAIGEENMNKIIEATKKKVLDSLVTVIQGK